MTQRRGVEGLGVAWNFLSVVLEQAKMAVDEGLSNVKHSKSSNNPISFLDYDGPSLCEIFIGSSGYGITRRGVEHLGVMLKSTAKCQFFVNKPLRTSCIVENMGRDSVLRG
jgi:hypothetical protein